MCIHIYIYSLYLRNAWLKSSPCFSFFVASPMPLFLKETFTSADAWESCNTVQWSIKIIKIKLYLIEGHSETFFSVFIQYWMRFFWLHSFPVTKASGNNIIVRANDRRRSNYTVHKKYHIFAFDCFFEFDYIICVYIFFHRYYRCNQLSCCC